MNVRSKLKTLASIKDLLIEALRMKDNNRAQRRIFLDLRNQ